MNLNKLLGMESVPLNWTVLVLFGILAGCALWARIALMTVYEVPLLLYLLMDAWLWTLPFICKR